MRKALSEARIERVQLELVTVPYALPSLAGCGGFKRRAQSAGPYSVLASDVGIIIYKVSLQCEKTWISIGRCAHAHF